MAIQFPSFGSYVCESDSVTVEHDGFTLRARIYRDDVPDSPEERDDGFWPSLDPASAGYIGPKSKATLRRETEKAQRILDAWRRDEWFYCGVCVTVERDGIRLTDEFAHALWGIECNYPDSDNSYLAETAADLAGEALQDARAILARLCECRHSAAQSA